jgi:hypothetical protein
MSRENVTGAHLVFNSEVKRPERPVNNAMAARNRLSTTPKEFPGKQWN